MSWHQWPPRRVRWVAVWSALLVAGTVAHVARGTTWEQASFVAFFLPMVVAGYIDRRSASSTDGAARPSVPRTGSR